MRVSSPGRNSRRVTLGGTLDSPSFAYVRPPSSSGRYFHETHRIVVTAGAERRDQRLTLLHELAHAATPGQHHSDEFWITAFRLFADYGVSLRYARERSRRYRSRAEIGYQALRAARKAA